MAMLSDALASQLTDTLAALIDDEVTMMKTVKSHLRRLENQVRTIHGTLEDAERKAIGEPDVRVWLSKLRDALYDADDIIDYFIAHAERLASSKHMRCYVPLVYVYHKLLFRHQFGGSIRSINQKLSEILQEKSKLGLVAAAPTATAAPLRGRDSRICRGAKSNVEPKIVEFENEDAINNLVSKIINDTGDQEMCVLGIVGEGGVGKTRLAEKMRNHEAVRENFQFPPPLWIHVSKNYNGLGLLLSLVEQAGGEPSIGSSAEEIQELFGTVVQEKKIFLTLDDVWDLGIWEEFLKTPLQKAAIGSRVLVTTRDEGIATRMGATHLHVVQRLSKEDSWSFLSKLVFQAGEQGEAGKLQEMGMQIAEKCDGMPLAIKAIAGVLMEKERRPEEWDRVLKHPAWSMTHLPEVAMRALYLSYEDLPSHLKQCFIFCSLFPEDAPYDRSNLAELWVAEGFVKDQKDMTPEEVAEEYYQELIRRNLMQPEDDDNSERLMQDSQRSLARLLAPDEYFVGHARRLVDASSRTLKLRHISIVDEEMEEFPEIIKKHTYARTLLFMGIPMMKQLPQDVFQKLRCLRALDLNGHNFMFIPDTLGSLIHLRHLDLSGYKMKELPETIGELFNLQYLYLQICTNLYRLPKSIAKLSKLRKIDINGTPIIGMPIGIGGLLHLHTITGFPASESENGIEEWASLDEIKSLLQLRSISITNLDKATTKAKSQEDLLKDKSFIINLSLHCSYRAQPYQEEEMKKIKEIFSKRLFPPPSVEELKIDGYFGLEFPSWMMDVNAVASTLLNLRRLVLLNCICSSQLPPLGQLPQLEYLDIIGAWEIRSVGAELMGNASIPFPKLQELKLEGLPLWGEWSSSDAVAMPHLQTLRIIHCPNLRSLPVFLRRAKALATLEITGCHNIKAIQGLSSLKTARLTYNFGLATLSDLPTLHILTLSECSALSHLVVGLPSLQILEWINSQMESLPDWLLSNGQKVFPMLQRFYATVGDVDVLGRCLMNGADWQKINDIPNISIRVLNGPEFIFCRKEPFKFDTNLTTI